MCADSGGEPKPDAKSAQECLAFHEQRIGKRSADAARLGVPLLMSEFGACLDSEACAREIMQVADISDKEIVGWAYWQFKTYKDLTTSAGDKSEGFYNNDGSLQNAKVKALARSYVPLTQGMLTKTAFNSDNGEFTATFKVDTEIDAPTVVHAFESGKGDSWYAAGAAVRLTGPKGELTADQVQMVPSAANKIAFKVVDESLNGSDIELFVSQRSHVECVTTKECYLLY